MITDFDREAIKFHGNLGENIKKARESKNITQQQLSVDANLSQSHISRIEAGERAASLYKIIKISRALNVSISDLLVNTSV